MCFHELLNRRKTTILNIFIYFDTRVFRLQKQISEERYLKMSDTFYKYSSIEELTPEILRSFIDKVIVHEKTKVDGHYRQTVEIVYNFVGAIDRPIWGDELDENN